VSASVNLPLHYKVQNFFSGTSSPVQSRKKGCKTVVVWWWWFCLLFLVVRLTGSNPNNSLTLWIFLSVIQSKPACPSVQHLLCINFPPPPYVTSRLISDSLCTKLSCYQHCYEHCKAIIFSKVTWVMEVCIMKVGYQLLCCSFVARKYRIWCSQSVFCCWI